MNKHAVPHRASLVLLAAAFSAMACSRSAGPSESEVGSEAAGAASGETVQHPVGITTSEAEFMEIIPAGTTLPHLFSKVFTTSQDEQDTVWISIAQKKPSGVELISQLVVEGIPEAKKAEAKVVLTVEVDAKQMLRLKTTISETAASKAYGPYPLVGPAPIEPGKANGEDSSTAAGPATDEG